MCNMAKNTSKMTLKQTERVLEGYLKDMIKLRDEMRRLMCEIVVKCPEYELSDEFQKLIANEELADKQIEDLRNYLDNFWS